MGDHSGLGYADERPCRLVYVADFFLARREVSFREWREVYRWATDHGYRFDNKGRKGWSTHQSNENHPVTLINWHDALKWCNARSEMEGLKPVYYEDEQKSRVYRTARIELSERKVDFDADGYRLPTEAEWEKAARGGLVQKFYPWGGNKGSFEAHIDRSRANYWPYVRTTSEAGSYSPNEFGLYDMAGNVWEWCWDRYEGFTPGPVSVPAAADSKKRILRGGGWRSVPYFLRCSLRLAKEPGETSGEFGFRLARNYHFPALEE